MTRYGRRLAILFPNLLVFWLLMNGSLAPDVVVVGIVASLGVALAWKDGLAFVGEFRFTPAAFLAMLAYFGYFAKELVKANLAVAALVVNPALPVHPAVVKARTKLKSRTGRLLLANSITLTPGTLTLELDGEWLFIHWVNAPATDVETATREIVAGFERYIEVMYG